MKANQVTQGEYNALECYEHAHGRYWKRELLADWERSDYLPDVSVAQLNQLRDTRGPKWLRRFSMANADVLPADWQALTCEKCGAEFEGVPPTFAPTLCESCVDTLLPGDDQ